MAVVVVARYFGTTIAYNPCAACVPGSAYSIARTETIIGSGATVSPPSRAYYDTLGRAILSAQSGLAGQDIYRETLYDSLGRIGYASLSYFATDARIRWTQYSFDALGRSTQTLLPDNTATTAAYNGRTTSVSNHNGVRSSRTVNSQGKVISIADAEATADASSVSYQYDPWGNLTQTTDAYGNVTTMAYDLRGRKTQLIDSDMGTWNYSVDNLGQVTTQLDARLQTTSFTYDVLGRLTRRFEPDLDSRWYFETNALGAACNKGIGKLCEATTTNGYFRRNTYDNLARLSSQTSHVDADYTAQWSYDPAGRLNTQTYPATVGAFPTPLAVKYNYSPLGLLQSVANNATGTPWWTRNAENADGNVTSETYGNGLIGSRSYDALMGRLVALQAGPGGAPGAVQNQRYHYDNLGRLDQRQDDTAGVGTSETFSHDNLNRLVAANLTAPGTGTQTTSVAFNAIGNLTSKSGVGTYAYNASGPASVRPHAVSGVSGTVNGVANPGYGYDANGNMLTDGARSFAWTSFNMPATLTKAAQAGSPGAGAGTFLYGPEHQRVKQTWVDGAKTLTTVYLSEPLFEKEVNSQTGLTEFKHYVRVGSSVVAVHTRRSNATEEVRYLIPDHLGSTSVVTDAAGAVIDRQAFDPWGDRRVASGAAAGAADPANLIQPTSTTRGFTGHEQLDQGNMGLTHMNGRVYDPTLGRFISADPNVQAPYSSQSFNRYSYLWNAPLSGTDPSGFVAETPSLLARVDVNGRCRCRLTGEDAIKFLEDWRGQEPAFLERAFKEIRSVQRGALIAAGVAQKAVRRALLSTRHPLPQLLGAIVILMNPDEVKQPGDDKKAQDGLKADGANAAAGGAAPPPEGDDDEKARQDKIRSHEKALEEHKQKLAQYRENPESMDNKGFLANAPSQEVRDSIIQGRVRTLENTIRNIERQIEMLKGSP